MKDNEFKKMCSKIVAKAWSDPQFKEQLLKNPEKVLREQGIEIPEGKQITVCENTESQFYLVIPQKPAGNLSEKQLESISAGERCVGDIC